MEPHLTPLMHTRKGLPYERRSSAYTFCPRRREEIFRTEPQLSRNGAYDAAARGEIPTIKIGRLLRVPIRALEAMLDRASDRAA